MKTIDLVVQEHIDPPTRQSLIVAFLLALNYDKSLRPPLGIGRTVSTLTDQQIRVLLDDRIAVVREKDGNEMVLARLNGALSRAANSRLIGQESHRVKQSLDANRYVGIGIAIVDAGSGAVMHNVIQGGPADRAGAARGDKILEVDGVSTKGLSIQEVIDLLRGAQGTEVEVEIRRNDLPTFVIKMRRDVVPFKYVRDFKVVEPGIAHVKVDRVSSSIVRDLRQLTPKIQEHNIRGLVIELMNVNDESDYASALLFANALTSGGNIGGVETNDGIKLVKADEDSLWPDLKIAIVPRFPLSDELAWAVTTLQFNNEAFPATNFRENRSAWKYGTIDVSEELLISNEAMLLRVPVARLLGIKQQQPGIHAEASDPMYFDLAIVGSLGFMVSPRARPRFSRQYPTVAPPDGVSSAIDSLEALIK